MLIVNLIPYPFSIHPILSNAVLAWERYFENVALNAMRFPFGVSYQAYLSAANS